MFTFVPFLAEYICFGFIHSWRCLPLLYWQMKMSAWASLAAEDACLCFICSWIYLLLSFIHSWRCHVSSGERMGTMAFSKSWIMWENLPIWWNAGWSNEPTHYVAPSNTLLWIRAWRWLLELASTHINHIFIIDANLIYCSAIYLSSHILKLW